MKKFITIAILIFLAYLGFTFFKKFDPAFDFNSIKAITIDDNGFSFSALSSANTVGEILKEKKISLGEHDQILPDMQTKIFSGTNIRIRRAVKIKIEVDGKTSEFWTTQNNIGFALAENKITLGHLDKVIPDINSTPATNTQIIITRINIEEKIIPEDIDFKIITNNDSELGWREEKITQQGEKGIREVKYKITYKNGREVSRVALEKNVTKDPVSQIVTKGTHMELGKANKGQGTWYAFKGGMFAASTSIPRGGYAKVTSLGSGKSIVVQINDYGPQGKGRIIDLDKVAFQKLAPLGAGVIGVKVEQILN